MSVWDYLTDAELESLQRLHGVIEATNKKIEAYKLSLRDLNQRTGVARSLQRQYKLDQNARAAGKNVEPVPPAETVDELTELYRITERRIEYKESVLVRLRKTFTARRTELLDACVDRATSDHAQKSKELIAVWRSLDAAQHVQSVEADLQAIVDDKRKN